MRAVIAIFALILSGCSTPAKITGWAGASVRPPANASAPSTVNSGQKTEQVDIPAGTVKTVTETAATATEPAKAVTVYSFPVATKETRVEAVQSISVSNERAPDQTVAMKKIDAAEGRWLLFTAIGCLVAGMVLKSIMPSWPGLSNGLLVASPLAFAAWKVSQVPPWLWGVVIAAMVLIALGYKRAEWDANKDGIPDILQKSHK